MSGSQSWRLGVLAKLLLALAFMGCAGAAVDGTQSCEDERHGWLCDADCKVCTCDGTVQPEPYTIGLCIEDWKGEL